MNFLLTLFSFSLFCKTNNGTQICILDEPSNFLDREALGGLAVAIRDWSGAVVRLSIFNAEKKLLTSFVAAYYFTQS